LQGEVILLTRKTDFREEKVKISLGKKTISFLTTIILLTFVTSFADNAEQNCKNEISKAKIKRIVIPRSYAMRDFWILPNNREVLFKFYFEEKTLDPREERDQYDATGPKYYYLKTLIPARKVKVVTSKEADDIIKEWQNAEKEQVGMTLVATSPDIKNKRAAIYRDEFWIYKTEDYSLSKIDWIEGKELMDKEKKSSLRKSQESPDGSKIIYQELVKKTRNRLLWMPISEFHFYRFGIRCKNGTGDKFFRVKPSYSYGCVSWASDSKLAIVADKCYNGSLIYMVYFQG
jgi:hypothetical protein